MKRDRVFLMLTILTIIFTVLGGTLAYWRWQTTSGQATSVTFTVGSTFSCSADGGGNITNNVYFVPTDCTNSTYAIKREITTHITNSGEDDVYLDMWLNINSIGSGLSNSENFKWALTTDSTSCTNNVVNSGNFNGKQANDKINLLEDVTDEDTYYLYIWLDKEETDASTMNQSVSLSLDGECGNQEPPKFYAYFGNSSDYFKNTAYKNNITSVSFVKNMNIPDNATNWDVGVSPSNANDVKAWLEDDGAGNNTFALKIGANGTIFVPDLSYAFKSLYNVSNFDFTGLNASETTNMAYMFHSVGYYASNVNIDLGANFNASNTTNMRGMFGEVGARSSNIIINLGNNFNASKATNMVTMFGTVGRNAYVILDLGANFNASNVTNMSSMFANIASNGYAKINLNNNFNSVNAIWFDNMFFNVGRRLLNLNLGNNFDASNVTNMANMFQFSGIYSSTYNLNLGDKFDTSNVTNMSGMFSYAGQTSKNWSLDLGNHFNTIKVQDMSHMFSSACQNNAMFNLNLGNNFDTRNVTNMVNMFQYVGSTVASDFSLNLGNKFNTANVTNMAHMFEGTGSKAIDWSLNLNNKFDTSNVTNMGSMFSSIGNNATNFSLNLGDNFNTSNVNYMVSMFYCAGQNATNFNIDLGDKFDMSKVTTAFGMFSNFGKSSLNQIVMDLSAGSFTNITGNSSMFNGVPSDKVTIYVKDSTAQQWIIDKNSTWGTNFSASNVLIKQ